jgi:hypothetical protein
MKRPPPRYKNRWTAPRHHDYPFQPPCVRRQSSPVFGQELHVCWVEVTPAGQTITIRGDPDMSPETRSAILEMAGLVAEALANGWQGEDDGPPERIGAFGEPTEEGAVL